MLFLVLLIVFNGLHFTKGSSQEQLGTTECLEGELVDLTCTPALDEIFYTGARLEDITCGNTDYFIYWSKISPLKETISHCKNVYKRISQHKIFLDNPRYILRIANVQKHNEGIYQCHTYNVQTRESNVVNEVQLKVYQPQCETYPISNVQFGDTFTIICSLQLKRTLQLLDSKNHLLAEIHRPNLKYVMNLTDENNFETFQCKALTGNGEYNPTCSISVRFPYVKIEPEGEVVAREGENVAFYCFAKLGKRKPSKYSYVWRVDKSPTRKCPGYTTAFMTLHLSRS